MKASSAILFVEDDPGLLCVMRAGCARFCPSFQIHEARTMAVALSRLEAQEFDAVLLDLMLPDSEGVHSFRVIHEAIGGMTPIVVLTGIGDRATQNQLMREGAEDYIIKGSTNLAQMIERLRHAVIRNQVRREMDSVFAPMEAAISNIREWSKSW